MWHVRYIKYILHTLKWRVLTNIQSNYKLKLFKNWIFEKFGKFNLNQILCQKISTLMFDNWEICQWFSS